VLRRLSKTLCDLHLLRRVRQAQSPTGRDDSALGLSTPSYRIRLNNPLNAPRAALEVQINIIRRSLSNSCCRRCSRSRVCASPLTLTHSTQEARAGAWQLAATANNLFTPAAPPPPGLIDSQVVYLEATYGGPSGVRGWGLAGGLGLGVVFELPAALSPNAQRPSPRSAASASCPPRQARCPFSVALPPGGLLGGRGASRSPPHTHPRPAPPAPH
jgi:hypothetical protein